MQYKGHQNQAKSNRQQKIMMAITLVISTPIKQYNDFIKRKNCIVEATPDNFLYAIKDLSTLIL